MPHALIVAPIIALAVVDVALAILERHARVPVAARAIRD